MVYHLPYLQVPSEGVVNNSYLIPTSAGWMSYPKPSMSIPLSTPRNYDEL